MSIIVRNKNFTKTYNKLLYINKNVNQFKEILKQDFNLDKNFNLHQNNFILKDNDILSKYLSIDTDTLFIINNLEYDIEKIGNYGLAGILLLLLLS